MLQVLTHELHRILSEAALFAHKSSDLPTINAVLLECDGTNLVALATDRFKLAISRVRLDVPADGEDGDRPAPFQTAIPLDQVNMLVQHLKTPRAFQSFRQVTLTSGANDSKIDVQESLAPNIFSFTSAYSAELSIKVVPVPDKFPNWRPLMSLDGAEAIRGIALDPHHLAPFFKVAAARGEHRLQLRFRGPNKPVLVQLGGGDFAGLVMPIRLPGADEEWDHSEWFSKLIAEAVTV